MSIAGSMFKLLGRRKSKPKPRKLKDFEKRSQAAQPFESIRQQLNAHGVEATPQLMQSYQDQAASEKVMPSAGATGKRSMVGSPGFGGGASLVMKGGPMAKRSKGGGAPNPLLQQLAQGQSSIGLTGGPMGKRSGSMIQQLLGGLVPGEKPEMPRGSFFQQELTGGDPNAPGPFRFMTKAARPGPFRFMTKAARENPYQWNRIYREGTGVTPDPF